jgi:cyanate permease
LVILHRLSTSPILSTIINSIAIGCNEIYLLTHLNWVYLARFKFENYQLDHFEGKSHRWFIGFIVMRKHSKFRRKLQDRWIWGVCWGVYYLRNGIGVFVIIRKALKKIFMSMSWSCPWERKQNDGQKWQNWRD